MNLSCCAYWGIGPRPSAAVILLGEAVSLQRLSRLCRVLPSMCCRSKLQQIVLRLPQQLRVLLLATSRVPAHASCWTESVYDFWSSFSTHTCPFGVGLFPRVYILWSHRSQQLCASCSFIRVLLLMCFCSRQRIPARRLASSGAFAVSSIDSFLHALVLY